MLNLGRDVLSYHLDKCTRPRTWRVAAYTPQSHHHSITRYKTKHKAPNFSPTLRTQEYQKKDNPAKNDCCAEASEKLQAKGSIDDVGPVVETDPAKRLRGLQQQALAASMANRFGPESPSATAGAGVARCAHGNCRLLFRGRRRWWG